MFKQAKYARNNLSAGALALIAGLGTATVQAQDPFIGELKLFGYNFCPRGWTEAAGQLLPISQNQALFSLYGTQYGGDGRTTFALPDLRGRAPIGFGNGPGLGNYAVGQKGGTENITITAANMPSHNHSATTASTLKASNGNGQANTPEGNILASDRKSKIYSADQVDVKMGSSAVQSVTTIGNTGGNQGIAKRSPYLAMRWCVALQGIFPSRN